MKLKRIFTAKYKGSFFEDLKDGKDCGINWISTDAIIKDVKGNVKFEQKNVEFPDFWSQTAINIVSSKYFYGSMHTDDREYSLRQIIVRVVDTLAKFGKKQGYFQLHKSNKKTIQDKDKPENIFKDELSYIFVHQYAFMNSPVWFNVGIYDKPLSSACYILKLDDTIESIIDVSSQEIRIFKDGAGTGKNLSNLRSKGENLSGGGKASGVLSFMRIYDVNANIIRAAGRTRRSAMLELLDVDHPEIMDFIQAKPHEEDKAHALLEAGFGNPLEIDNEAVQTVAFQNMNISVGVTDEFMKAVRNEDIWQTKFRRPDLMISDDKPPEYPAQTILEEISKATHRCGDPGIFYLDTINHWNTCANDFKIRSSNPCLSEDTWLITDKGIREIKSLVDENDVNILNPDGFCKSRIIKTGVRSLFLLKTDAGFEIKCTSDHPIRHASGKYIKARHCVGKDITIAIKDISSWKSKDSSNLNENALILKGYLFGSSIYGKKDNDIIQALACELNEDPAKFLDKNISEHNFIQNIFKYSKQQIAAFIRGVFSANGHIVEHKQITLESINKSAALLIQKLLTLYGIYSYITANRFQFVKLDDNTQKYREICNLNIEHQSGLINFKKYIGFVQNYKTEELDSIIAKNADTDKLFYTTKVLSITYIGEEPVYDFQILNPEAEPVGWADGIWVHNCGEFLWTDNSACNLASINLLKFKDTDNTFNDVLFGHVIRNVVIAQDILIDMSFYPSEIIRENSLKYRPIGLGYGNLGGLLMAYGVPYDSEIGRSIASVVTAYMTAKAYQTSGEIAQVLEPYKRYEHNKDSHWNVINMHSNAFQVINAQYVPSEFSKIMQNASKIFSSLITHKYPLRNAQVTLLAPCGTIGFAMDLDSTGIEPLMGTVTYKTISGGGTIKIVPKVTKIGLQALGYLEESEINEILEYIKTNDTIENAPYIKEDDLAVFDCAYNHRGSRVISPEGHIRMLSAVQPFLSGGISKTVSLPNDATVEDIYNTYMLAWDMGLKNISIYRDGSKNVQPLLTRIEEKREDEAKSHGRFRKRMPKTRPSIIHKFQVGEQEVYLTIGLYEDGLPGEIFINCSRTGSTINGLLDTFATMVSISLQSGVPLEVLVDKFKYQKFEPSGITDNPDIRSADSIVDYIFKYLEKRFLIDENDSLTKKFTINQAIDYIKDNIKKPTKLEKTKSTGDICPICGRIMRRTGTCKTCVCGNSGGCEW